MDSDFRHDRGGGRGDISDSADSVPAPADDARSRNRHLRVASRVSGPVFFPTPDGVCRAVGADSSASVASFCGPRVGPEQTGRTGSQ